MERWPLFLKFFLHLLVCYKFSFLVFELFCSDLMFSILCSLLNFSNLFSYEFNFCIWRNILLIKNFVHLNWILSCGSVGTISFGSQVYQVIMGLQMEIWWLWPVDNCKQSVYLRIVFPIDICFLMVFWPANEINWFVFVFLNLITKFRIFQALQFSYLLLPSYLYNLPYLCNIWLHPKNRQMRILASNRTWFVLHSICKFFLFLFADFRFIFFFDNLCILLHFI